ncbi:MAG: VWA domain-containing protein [Acidobacteria bacterium]|nr:VWA domain-containing protein [Acidobacteriota bacterium]
MRRLPLKAITGLALTMILFASYSIGQDISYSGELIEIENSFGRIDVSVSDEENVVRIESSAGSKNDDRVSAQKTGGRILISVKSNAGNERIDVSVKIPLRSKIKAITTEGEIRISGNFALIDARTGTGTISTEIPDSDIKYDLKWTASRPRFVADFELAKVRERSGGRFEIKGRYRAENNPENNNSSSEEDEQTVARDIQLSVSTARGIVLLNVPPNEVTSDLRERPLTEAAKAIIRSGDRVMMDAIRRAAPKYFGDYERTLPPISRTPQLTSGSRENSNVTGRVKRAAITVTDLQNRAVPGLAASDFEITENGLSRQIISVEKVQAPVNLVLLLDVSGSIENYVTFIRKAARSFVETVDAEDRISIVIFSEDVKVLANFSTDKTRLSESLDTFDAGGATAYYDSLGFAISESLRPLKGERTAIVILTDGDDNRSFLAFDSLIGAVEESGALIYPLYVPSGLVAASAANGLGDIDPLRNRHLTLTSKADDEGKQLAKVSGGVYYPISQLSQIQTAYEDIVVQLRAGYEITFSSASAGSPDNDTRQASPTLRIRSKRPNTFVQIGQVESVQ